MNITTKALLKSFFANLFLSIIKILTGLFGKSSALVADGIHSFSDLATDAVSIFGNHYALKPADKEHPFGHGKMEYLTCLIIGAIVLVLGIEIIITSLKDEFVIPSKLVILVSIFTIIIKFILFTYLLKVGKKYNNEILIASGKESSADVISSLFVLISCVLMQFSKQVVILKYSNLIATVIVGFLIIKTGFCIIKENSSFILGEQEEGLLEEVLEIINQEELIKQVDQFIIMKNGPYVQITGEVSMNGNLSLNEVHEVIEKLENLIQQFDSRARYINIHVNPIEIEK